MVGDCAACAAGHTASECRGAFAAAGVMKVHWEAWSDCNLACPFCYRTRDTPLNTAAARLLLGAIAASGAKAVVFAGGDPSLRRDLAELCSHARDLGLTVEIQTNAHALRASVRRAVEGADLVGLSLDGPDASCHDAVRGRLGNYDRVVNLLHELSAKGTPVIVRSLIVPGNHESIHRLSALIEECPSIVRWSLLEFTAANEGFANRSAYALDSALFDAAVTRCRSAYRGAADVDVYRNVDKTGTYALVTPGGRLYGTAELEDGQYPTVGSMMSDHLCELIRRLTFEPDKHERRYGTQLSALPLAGSGTDPAAAGDVSDH